MQPSSLILLYLAGGVLAQSEFPTGPMIGPLPLDISANNTIARPALNDSRLTLFFLNPAARYTASLLAADSVSTTYAVTCTALATAARLCPERPFELTARGNAYNWQAAGPSRGAFVKESLGLSLISSVRSTYVGVTYTAFINEDPATITEGQNAGSLSNFAGTVLPSTAPQAVITVTAGLEKTSGASTVTHTGVVLPNDEPTTTPTTSVSGNTTADAGAPSQGGAGSVIGSFVNGSGLGRVLMGAAGGIAFLAFML